MSQDQPTWKRGFVGCVGALVLFLVVPVLVFAVPLWMRMARASRNAADVCEAAELGTTTDAFRALAEARGMRVVETWESEPGTGDYLVMQAEDGAMTATYACRARFDPLGQLDGADLLTLD